MSESNTIPDEWSELWKEYSNALEKWKQVFESMQKASIEIQEKYNEVMKKATSESSQDTLKEFGENWQKAMSEAGMTAFKQFGGSWQKTMNESSLESMKGYGEMMNKFAETWKKMWRV